MARKHGDSRPRHLRGGINVKDLNAAYGSGPTVGEATPEDWARARRRMLERHLDRATERPRLRIGRGASVTRDEAQHYARKIFAWVLYRVAPETTAYFTTQDVMDTERWYERERIAALHTAANDPELSTLPYSIEVLADLSPQLANAMNAKLVVIESWQDTYRLGGEWLANEAWMTMQVACEMDDEGLVLKAPIGSWTLGRTIPDVEPPADREVIEEFGSFVYPVFVDDLKYTLDESGFDLFNPEKESLEAATDRLLENLRPRLHRALEDIRDKHNDAVDGREPIAFRNLNAFEWLVRYQVKDEGMRAIARSDSVDPAHVSRSIREIARLVELTLRPYKRAGRPRKSVDFSSANS